MPRRARRPKVVEVSIFAGPRLLVDGEPVALSPFEGYLLALVCGHPPGISRSLASHYLWCEPDGKKQRHRISQLVYQLNRKTTVPLVLTDTGYLQRNPEVGLREEIEHAARPPSGPTAEYERWMENLAVAWRAERLEALCAALVESRSIGSWAAAEEAARGLMALQPDVEDHVQAAIEAVLLQGQPLRARALVEHHRQVRLRSDPEWAIPDQWARILSSDSSALAPCHSHQSGSFLGRGSTLAEAEAFLRADTPDARVLVVSGGAGLGKSRLATELQRLASVSTPATIAFVELSRWHARTPFAALCDLLQTLPWQTLRDGLPADARNTLEALLAPVRAGDAAGHVAGATIAWATARAFTKLCQVGAAAAPVVVMVDDAHYLDASSAGCLDGVLSTWSGPGPLRVCAFLNPGAAPPHVLQLFDSHALGCRSRIQLDPLPDEVIQVIVEDENPGLSARSVAELVTLAGGNPLVAREFASAGRVEELRPYARLKPPARLEAWVQAIVRSLPRSARTLAQSIAVAGTRVSEREASMLSRLKRGQVRAAVNRFRSCRLVETRNGWIVQPQRAIRDAIYMTIPPQVRRELHRRFAELLLQREDPPPGMLAEHCGEAGDHEGLVKFANCAADRARDTGAMPEELHWLEVVRRASPERGDDLGLLGRIAELHYHLRRGAQAAAHLELLATKSKQTGDWARHLRAELLGLELRLTDGAKASELRRSTRELLRQAARKDAWELWAQTLDFEVRLAEVAGPPSAPRQLFRLAEDHLDTVPPRARCRLLATLAYRILYGKGPDGLEAAREAAGMAKRHGFDDLKEITHVRLVAGLVAQGKLHTPIGRRAEDDAFELAARMNDIHLRFLFHLDIGVWHLDVGSLAQAGESFARASELLQGTPSPQEAAMLNLNLGELALEEGSFDEALIHFAEADRHLGLQENSRLGWIRAAGPGLAAIALGRRREARARQEEMPALPSTWATDPTLPTRFAARMLRIDRKGTLGAALATEVAARSARRFPLASLRLYDYAVTAWAQEGERSRAHAALQQAQAVADSINHPSCSARVSRLRSAIRG